MNPAQPKPMTKARMRALAKQARRFGYSHNVQTGEFGVKCPLCQDRVNAQHHPGATITQKLDNAVIAHYVDGYCEAPEAVAGT